MKTSSIVSKKTSPYFKGLHAAPESTADGGLTIVLMPGDSYTGLAEAAHQLAAMKDPSIRFLIVEGNAPESVKHRLEKSSHDHAFCKILYSHHRPTITEAINMAVIHITTPYVFFMSGDVRFVAGDAQGLLRALKAEKADIVQPIFSGQKKPVWQAAFLENKTPFIDPRALLMTTACLKRLGNLEEYDWRISGVDLAYVAQAQNLHVLNTNEVAIGLTGRHSPDCAEDKELKNIQWNPSASKNSLLKITRKWNVKISELKYLQSVITVRCSDILNSKNGRKGFLSTLCFCLNWRSHLYSLVSYVKIIFKSGAASKTGSPREISND